MVADSRATRAALATIVVVSVAIALLWLLVTPFFQEPDENSHFDYAYALYSVGRPYRITDPACARDVTPTVRYLERRSDFYGVRLLAAAREPRDYGEPAYFRSVDAFAPVPSRRAPQPGSETPCVMFTYPAGFYALVAGVIALASLASHGSLVAEFFSARAFGILCLALSLPMCYRLLRESGATVRDALLATAAIGVFPMTSWVSAYVQPDNLTFTGVTLALLAALRLQRRPFDPLASLLLGSVLSALAFVKQPYAGVVYVACALLAGSGALRRGATSRQRLTPVVLVCLMPLVALRLATFATPAGMLHVAPTLAPTAAVPAAAGPLHSGLLFVAYAASTLYDAYVSGVSFERFWNGFGWTDVPYYANADLARAVESAIGALSLGLAGAFVLRQLFVLRRISSIAVRRSAASAAALLCRDVVLNAYVLWTALLIVVCAASRGTWTLQGRYWLPMMAPLLVLLACRLPRVLPRAMRPRAATLAAGALLGYGVVSAPFALSAERARYYGAAPVAARSTVVGVDGVGFLGEAHAGTRSIAVRRGVTVTLTGSAFAATDGSPIERVSLAVDAGRPQRATYGFAIPTAIAPMRVGFAGRLATHALAPGTHRIAIYAYAPRRPVDRYDSRVVLHVIGGPALAGAAAQKRVSWAHHASRSSDDGRDQQ